MLAAVALSAVLVTAATARPLDFLHIRTNLSHTTTLVSADPDLAASPDAGHVAVVWTEGYTGVVGNKGHVYLRAASETDAGWSGKVRAFSGSQSVYAYDAAVAITDTTAHVLYVVGLQDWTEVRHKTCDLEDLARVSCDVSASLVFAVNRSVGQISRVDIALDVHGRPHIVWEWRQEASGDGRISYRARDASGWGSIEAVASDGDNNRPSIAWADGYAHVVWQERTAPSIMYWRRAGSGGGSTEELYSSQAISYSVPNPDVAAGAGHVFVVWEQCAGLDGPVCRTYNLAYRRSNDKGASWVGEIREVGSDRVTFGEEYSSVNVLSEMSEFLLYLRPSISLNEDGWPVVVWHAESADDTQGTEYVIYYSYASSGASADSLEWEVNPPSTLFTGMVGSAAVGVGQGDSSPVLHVAFMQQVNANAWDVFYGSNEEDRYPHVYLPLVAKDYRSYRYLYLPFVAKAHHGATAALHATTSRRPGAR